MVETPDSRRLAAITQTVRTVQSAVINTALTASSATETRVSELQLYICTSHPLPGRNTAAAKQNSEGVGHRCCEASDRHGRQMSFHQALYCFSKTGHFSTLGYFCFIQYVCNIMHLGVCDNSFKQTCLIPGRNVQWQSHQREVTPPVPGCSFLESDLKYFELACVKKSMIFWSRYDSGYSYKRIVHPEIQVLSSSSSCCPKPVSVYFICRTQNKICNCHIIKGVQNATFIETIF